ncbi:hypothetical protein KUTeg_012420 [Tegillarca granosa]|uniref:Uncharacterized protein n=1 Tax=Tegillarca granosa TaxID=220873 RepID=A0ABQ9F310_TEGGR|nr:hypothetical protein KUTeg_012420 [Tegillarca granosa]
MFIFVEEVCKACGKKAKLGKKLLDCSKPILAVVVLPAGIAIRGFRFSGYLVNSLDITPNFGGVVFSVTNSISSISAYVALMITSSITTNLSRQEWQIVFIITSSIEMFGSLFYLMFASTDVQSWNSTNKDEDKVSELTSDIVTHM